MISPTEIPAPTPMPPPKADDIIMPAVCTALTTIFSDEDAPINGGDLVQAIGLIFGTRDTVTDRYFGLILLEQMAREVEANRTTP
ncbi:MAG: hypothetical protein RQ731_08015 [Anaerosomatales bacterium]|nr:hypothetical protein [Anaerosomatales bacterium]